MRYLTFGLFLLFLFSCGGPRPTLKVNVLSQSGTNEGRALPMHIVPVDAPLRVKLESMTAEEWFVSDDVDTLTGIQKRVMRGAQTEVINMERRNSKNDFIVVVDFAEIEGSDAQKLFIGDQYYRAKEIYVVVTRDRARVVSKEVFNEFMQSN